MPISELFITLNQLEELYVTKRQYREKRKAINIYV